MLISKRNSIIKIKKAVYVRSIVKIDKSLSDLPHIVFFGRSNVGKSSFINMVCNRKKLSYFSKKPGKTKCINFFNINDYVYLVDCPGYGYANISKTKQKVFSHMMNSYISYYYKNMVSFILLDSRHLPSVQDITMIKFLKDFNLEFNIIFTKIDKLKSNNINSNIERIKNTINYNGNYIVSSATKKIGFDCFWKQVDSNIDIDKKKY